MAITDAPEHLTYAEARARVLGAVRPLDPETVPLSLAAGRALRRTLVAPHPLPPFRNSSMDGYASRSADLAGASAANPVLLPVVEVIPAGRVASRPLAAGEVMRIMTGAEIPAGADAVVPFEDAERLEGAHERARFVRPAGAGANVRAAGADLAAGETALAEGRELSAHDLALAAALGFDRVPVGARPRAAVLSTGDELLDPGEPLRPGAIRDSNLGMLELLLREAGCEVAMAERVRDDETRVARWIARAFEVADVVVTIGGVSAGDFDPVKRALGGALDARLWRVAMKPGRPQAFGATGGRLFYGLPGNPASVACVFEALLRPALRALQGFSAVDRPRVRARATERIESREGRTDFVRVSLAARDGAWQATPAGEQVSGHLVPQSRAHALLVVPESASRLDPGDAADALVLRLPEAGAA